MTGPLPDQGPRSCGGRRDRGPQCRTGTAGSDWQQRCNTCNAAIERNGLLQLTQAGVTNDTSVVCTVTSDDKLLLFVRFVLD